MTSGYGYMAVVALLCAGVAGAAVAEGAARLSGGDWRVQTIVGGPLPEGVQPTIGFAEEGRLSGQSGCNRFMGGYLQDGAVLTISQIGATKMACPAENMETERRMFDALQATRGFALTPGGALELLAGNGALILRATR